MRRSGGSKWNWIGSKKSPDCRGRRTTRVDRGRTFGIERHATVSAGGTVAFGLVLRAAGRERVESQTDAVFGRAVHQDTLLWRTEDDAGTPRSRLCRQSETSPATSATDGLGGDLSKTALVGSRTGSSHLSVPAAQCRHRATQSSVVERHHVYPAASGFHLPRDSHGLVQPLCAQLGNIDEPGCGILLFGTGPRAAARASGNIQHRSGRAIHQRCVHGPARSREHSDQHGRPWPCAGQRLRGTVVENGQIRRRLPEGLQRSSRRGAESRALLPLLQWTTSASSSGLSNARSRVSWSGKGKDAATRLLLLMSFKGMRKSIRTMGAPANTADVPAHLSDEFPAGYSLTRCSPAELASASPAGVDDVSAQVQVRGFFNNNRTRTEKRDQFHRQQSTLRSPFFCPKNGETLTERISKKGIPAFQAADLIAWKNRIAVTNIIGHIESAQLGQELIDSIDREVESLGSAFLVPADAHLMRRQELLKTCA